MTSATDKIHTYHVAVFVAGLFTGVIAALGVIHLADKNTPVFVKPAPGIQPPIIRGEDQDAPALP